LPHEMFIRERQSITAVRRAMYFVFFFDVIVIILPWTPNFLKNKSLKRVYPCLL
jgi:hypothetical protein